MKFQKKDRNIKWEVTDVIVNDKEAEGVYFIAYNRKTDCFVLVNLVNGDISEIEHESLEKMKEREELEHDVLYKGQKLKIVIEE